VAPSLPNTTGGGGLRPNWAPHYPSQLFRSSGTIACFGSAWPADLPPLFLPRGPDLGPPQKGCGALSTPCCKSHHPEIPIGLFYERPGGSGANEQRGHRGAWLCLSPALSGRGGLKPKLWFCDTACEKERGLVGGSRAPLVGGSRTSLAAGGSRTSLGAAFPCCGWRKPHVLGWRKPRFLGWRKPRFLGWRKPRFLGCWLAEAALPWKPRFLVGCGTTGFFCGDARLCPPPPGPSPRPACYPRPMSRLSRELDRTWTQGFIFLPDLGAKA
jgi:hypothetical protein